MTEYILMVGWIVFACFLFKLDISKRKSNPLTEKRMQNKKLLQAIIYFTPVFFLMAFKGVKVGPDTENYIRLFKEMNSQSVGQLISENTKDWGYYLFAKGINVLSHNPQVLLIVCAVIIALGYALFFAKTSNNIFLCALGYLSFGLFAFNLSGIRQSIAMVICLFAMRQIEKKSLIKFLLIVALAFTFHASAIFFLPAYFIGIKKPKKYDMVMFLGIGILVGVFFEPLNKLIFANVADYERYGVEKADNGYIFALVMICILVLTEFLKKQILQKDPKKRVYINLNYIAMALWIVRLFTRTAERPFLYFLPATIVCYSLIPENFGRKERQLITGVMTILTILLFLYRIRALPYQFC